MHLGWILNPLTLYTILALGLLATLVLFSSMKVEIAQAERKAEEAEAAVGETAARTATEIEGLRELISNMQAVAPSRPVAAGIDLNRRSQVLRMHRRGESVATIAAALETPRNEIELLLKVHNLTAVDQARKAS